MKANQWARRQPPQRCPDLRDSEAGEELPLSVRPGLLEATACLLRGPRVLFMESVVTCSLRWRSRSGNASPGLTLTCRNALLSQVSVPQFPYL